MSNDESRRCYEKFVCSQPEAEPNETKRDDLGYYRYSDVAYGWKAWKAAEFEFGKRLKDLQLENNALHIKCEELSTTVGALHLKLLGVASEVEERCIQIIRNECEQNCHPIQVDSVLQKVIGTIRKGEK